jgi:hypothetical protein
MLIWGTRRRAFLPQRACESTERWRRERLPLLYPNCMAQVLRRPGAVPLTDV